MIVAVLFASLAAAAPVALVIDVEGRATVAGRDLRLLGEMAAGSEVTLEAGGRVVLLYLADGVEYALAGPGRFRIAANGPRGGAGMPSPVRSAPATRWRDTRLRSDRIVQGGHVMRGPERATLQRPVNELVVTPGVVFAWESQGEATTYRLDVVDAGGRSVLAVETDATEYRAEASALRPGQRYRWSIRGQHPSTREPFYAASEFRTADAGQRRALADARPAADADFAQQVRYVALLERIGARSEAQAMREALASRRVAAWAPAR